MEKESKNEVENNKTFASMDRYQKNSYRVKKGILTVIVLLSLLYPIMRLIDSGPDLGNGLGLIFMLFFAPIMLFASPIYCVVLAFRYAKEKSNMDSIDKITFYYLMFFFVVYFLS